MAFLERMTDGKENMEKKQDRKIFAAYMAGFLILAATLALMQPLADTPPLYPNAPDEHARFLVPWYICQHGVIPTGFEEEVRIPAYGFSYILYNAFPYIVQGYIMRFVSIFTSSQQILLYVGRLVNVFSGACMAWVVWLLGKRLFKERKWGVVFSFLVTYLPESLFMHTYINTDSMCMLATAMIVYGLVSAWQDDFCIKNSMCLAAGIILCALSYYNAYGFILSSILLFLAFYWKKSFKSMLSMGIPICVVVLAGISWWFIRSYLLYDGDFLGLATRTKMSEQYAIAQVNPLTMPTYQNKGYSILQMMEENHFVEGAFRSFVGVFGSMSLVGNIWMYRFYKLFFAAGGLGCILLNGKIYELAVGRKNTSRLWVGADLKKERTMGQWCFFHANMIFCILMPTALLIYYAYTMDYQNQGRYLLPAIVPLMYYLVRGFEKLAQIKYWPKWLARLILVLAAAFVVLSAVYMVYIVSVPVYLGYHPLL